MFADDSAELARQHRRLTRIIERHENRLEQEQLLLDALEAEATAARAELKALERVGWRRLASAVTGNREGDLKRVTNRVRSAETRISRQRAEIERLGDRLMDARARRSSLAPVAAPAPPRTSILDRRPPADAPRPSRKSTAAGQRRADRAADDDPVVRLERLTAVAVTGRELVIEIRKLMTLSAVGVTGAVWELARIVDGSGRRGWRPRLARLELALRRLSGGAGRVSPVAGRLEQSAAEFSAARQQAVVITELMAELDRRIAALAPADSDVVEPPLGRALSSDSFAHFLRAVRHGRVDEPLLNYLAAFESVADQTRAMLQATEKQRGQLVQEVKRLPSATGPA